MTRFVVHRGQHRRPAFIPHRSGFTLVELLVVIAIIGILVSLLLPAVQAARESARRVQCENNLKQLALGCLAYHDQKNIFPNGCTFPNADGPNVDYSTDFGVNWAIAILPFIDQEALYLTFDFTQPISVDNTPGGTSNRLARGTELSVMTCPSDVGHNVKFSRSGEGDNWARGNYGANGSLGFMSSSFRPAFGTNSQYWQTRWTRGVMGANASVNIAQITDGTSNTIMLGELRVGLAAVDRRGTWAMGAPGASTLFGHGTDDDNAPDDCTASADNILGCSDIFSALGSAAVTQACMGCVDGNTQAVPRSSHYAGIYVAMCDGSVRFIADFIESGDPWSFDPTQPVDPTVFLTWQRLNASADALPIDASRY